MAAAAVPEPFLALDEAEDWAADEIAAVIEIAEVGAVGGAAELLLVTVGLEELGRPDEGLLLMTEDELDLVEPVAAPVELADDLAMLEVAFVELELILAELEAAREELDKAVEELEIGEERDRLLELEPIADEDDRLWDETLAELEDGTGVLLDGEDVEAFCEEDAEADARCCRLAGVLKKEPDLSGIKPVLTVGTVSIAKIWQVESAETLPSLVVPAAKSPPAFLASTESADASLIIVRLYLFASAPDNRSEGSLTPLAFFIV